MKSLANAIASTRIWVELLHKFAPNDKWTNHNLYQRWSDRNQRHHLSDADYLELELYLRRCCDRVLQLHRERK